VTTRALILAIVIACKRDPAEHVPPAPPPAGDAAASQDAAPQAVELLHTVATRVTVSSTVANKAIVPAHLVDRDPGTAWNSRTGDLNTAWIEIAVPKQAVVKQLKLIAGNTGKGPKGEDYFTMNPRIQSVSVLHGTHYVKTASLDIEKRDLQTIDVPDLAGDQPIRLELKDVKLGSKQRWRETCVAELEVWGTVPASEPRAAAPTIVVDAHVTAQATCDEFDAELKAYEGHHPCDQCGGNEAGSPGCQVTLYDAFKPSGPWRHVGKRCHTSDQHYVPWDCPLLVETTDWWFGPTMGHSDDPVDLEVRDVVPGGDPELVVRGHNGTDFVVVCKTDRTCTEPREISGDTWTAVATFRDAKLVVGAGSGAAPAAVLGTFPLVFKAMAP